MNILYFITHRCIFSSFSKEIIGQKKRTLEDHGIKTFLKTHNGNVQTGTFGQLGEYQITYDLYVPNKDYDDAQSLLRRI
ncbi:MAG: DUF2007 domain-containing protein [Candidatus Faecousia sp.]|nr:DUF2007 domain-containing protein [Candidatus Faecousia sp.]